MRTFEELDAALSGTDDSVRWSAATELSDYAEENPDFIWPLVIKHGSSSDGDLRSAIATCALEHILEHHFAEYFDRLADAMAQRNSKLALTFGCCWKLGEARLADNAQRWDDLLRKHRPE